MAKEETRQSAKETLRLFLLDSLFQQERYFTKTELTEKLEVSIQTLDRDIRRLRDDFNAPLEYNSEKGGYHYSSKLFKLPSVFVPEQEMPAAHKDGAVLVNFTSNQPLGILRSFFAYGEDIIPLAPQAFVAEWTETVKKMAKSLGL